MLSMNASQAWSLVRSALKVVGAFLVTRGYLTEAQDASLLDNLNVVFGAIMTIVPIAIDLWVNTHKQKAASLSAAGGVGIPPSTVQAPGSGMRSLAILCVCASLLPLLGACSTLQNAYTAVTKPFNTDSPQKVVLSLQQAHQAELIVFATYLKQTPCGMPGAAPAPLCASYAVGIQWKKAEDAFDTAINAAENALSTMGDQTTIVQAAITTAKNAYQALQTISTQYGASK
jgi:hypothetical protein